MLGINLRLADAAEFTNPMTKFVSANYSQDQAKDVQKSIVEFQEERHKLAQLFAKSDAALETTIQSALRYLSRLIIISSHFPFGAADSQSSFLSRIISSKVTTVSVPFTWNDAFRPAGKLTSYHLTFERASVIFNIAALCSRVGVNKKAAKDDSSLREAQAQFLTAAGVYDWMTHSADVTASSLTSPDFHVDLLYMLKFLMLAQAQACYFEVATANAAKISPGTISKLAMGTAELYRSAYNYADKPHVKALFTQYKWHHHIYFQLMAYQAAASYWTAKQLMKDEKYGEEIAQLNRALLCLSNARAVEGGLVHTVIEHRTKLESELNTRQKIAMKDNESIYYAVIPKPETVKDPDSIVKVQLTPFNPPSAADLPDPFASLVPNVFREANAAFKTKLTGLIQTATRKHREQEEHVRTLLASLNLPGCLESSSDAKSDASPLPDATWESLRECQAAGSAKALEELSKQVVACAHESQTAHTKLVETLVKERSEDGDMRTKFSTRWNRRPSEQLTAALVLEADAIGKFLQEASIANGKLFADFDNNRRGLEWLARSRPEIEAKFPVVQAPVPSQVDDSILAMEVEMKSRMTELTAAVAEGNKGLEKWTAETQRADIVSLLVQGLGSNPRNISESAAAPAAAASSASASSSSPAPSPTAPVSVDRISTSEYLRYEAQLKDLETFYTKYDAIFSSIHGTFDKWQAAKNSRTGAVDKSRSERQALLQEIHQAVATFHRLQRHFNEAMTFYADIESQKIRPLKQRVTDFVFARDEEKKMLLEQLTHQMAAVPPVPVAQPVFNSGSPYPAFNPVSAAPPSVSLSPSSNLPAFNPYAGVAANPNLSADRPAHPMYASFGAPPATAPALASALAPSSVSPPTASSPAAANGAEWTCAKCTFINPARVAKCDMCGAPKA